MMNENEQPKIETDDEPLFYICWRNEATNKGGCGTGLYSKDEALAWVAALNRDESNVKQGLVHWMEPKR